MKKSRYAVALAASALALLPLVGAPVHAGKKADAMCPTMGVLAESVMLRRQQDRRLSEALAVVDEAAKEGSVDKSTLELTRAITMLAYGAPEYNTGDPERWVEAFVNEVEVSCFTKWGTSDG